MSTPRAPVRKRFPAALAAGGAPAGASMRRAPTGPQPAALQRPQRLVQEAAADAARQRVPSGLGLDSAAVRARMVERLRAQGVDDERVLAAFAKVERHRFVDTALANQAYEDTALPIGLGQTISKPSVVASMLQCLLQRRAAPGGRNARPLGRVLEIGAGCGYQAALLACLAERVVSIERLQPLAAKARANLQAAGWLHVEVLHGDGRLGAAHAAPFDAIVSAAGSDEVPEAWLEQLALGGRLVAPIRGGAGEQTLVVIERDPQGLIRRSAGPVHFVPLKSGVE
jgi:protein-L-isoaspartate(D-aspartate) O-methyltransferase